MARDEVREPIRISYRFRFVERPGKEHDRRFEVVLDGETLARVDAGEHALPPWTELETHKCAGCPLSSADHPTCPAAAALATVVEAFRDESSTICVRTEVETVERTYVKESALQQGLQSLFGLVMATSGCPHLEFLRPMARFHLPFATIDETMVRVASMHLLSRYVSARRGGPETLDLDGLAHHYTEVATVNLGMLARLRMLGVRDGGRNAIAILDVFGKMTRLEAKDDFPVLARLF